MLCDLYQRTNSTTPLDIGRTVGDVVKAVTWALSVLSPSLGKGAALGCLASIAIPNFESLANAKKMGGMIDAPPGCQKTENNVYGGYILRRRR